MKKKSLAASILLVLATLANGFQQHSEGWMKYSSAEGRYSVLLPQQPKLSSQESVGSSGEKMTQYMAQASDPGGLFMMAYFDIPPGNTYSLDKGRDGLLNAVKGTLLSETAISLGEYAGRDLKVLVKTPEYEALVRARLYQVEGRVYLLQHLFLKADDSTATAEKTARFFDSFKLTPVN